MASHTRPTNSVPNVSPTTLSLRNNPPPGTQSVLGTALIPRDYLGSSSKSRLNSSSNPYPPTQASPSTPSSSGVSSHATARALSRNDSSDDEEYEDDIVQEEPDEASSNVDIKVAKTRTIATTRTTQLQPLQKTIPRVESPKTTTPSVTPESLNTMPRTSSIDSAISNISTSSGPQKALADNREPTITDIRNLIATAGSAENLVQHLLRDKAHAASQNAQLWKLVDKQRALLLGLNKDLERVTKERDRYRKKAKELQALALHEYNNHNAAHNTPPTSAGDEPHSQLPLGPGPAVQADGQWAAPTQPSQQHYVEGARSTPDRAMMPSPLHPQQHRSVNETLADNSPTSPILANPSQTKQGPPHQAPKLAALTTSLAPPPAFSVTEATPLAESPARAFPAQRKAPPKPLDLTHLREEQSQSQSEEQQSDDRGRRKTREEDDRDREIAVQQEEEARSRSKKEKRSKVDQTRGEEVQRSPNEFVRQQQTTTLPLSPPQQGGNPLLVAQPPTGDPLRRTLSGTEQRLLSPPLRSPGLPASPRPIDRPLASPLPAFMAQPAPSLPMSPRNGGFPLSPRAPKQPLPAPTNLHAPDALSHRPVESSSLSHTDATQDSDRHQTNDQNMSSSEIPNVYKGLVSPTWPDLLLPPNALPSIQVKVASSRLRPSRFSVLGFKPQEDTSVFSLSVFSRSGSGELWRLEKIPASLVHLERQLRPRCPDLPPLPDRRLFAGHAPATLDSRRTAIDSYFDELLDIHIDEQSALLICKYLSTDVLEPVTENKSKPGQSMQAHGQVDAIEKGKKTGYLTKKGKNFGGWKSRYFVLDSPELRYFEAPGGAHLGTVKLQGAKIGRQTTTDGSHEDGDSEGQFRHAFLILEPKRRDGNSYVRHVLCAENDAERDDWVRALLYYVEDGFPQDSRPTTSGAASESSGMTSNPRSLLRGTDFADSLADSTAKSSSPMLGPLNSGSNSPTSPSPATPEGSAREGYWPKPSSAHSGLAPSGSQKNHLKPGQPPTHSSKEQKIKNLFQFRKPSHEQLNASHNADGRAHRDRAYVRPVFGLSLAEAVDTCPPHGVDVLLPAVVYRCIEYLREQKAANEEGLFRIGGSNLVIRTLKERFSTEGDVDLVADEEYYDVHAVASLFKTYLRELPSTILTRELHIEFCKVLEFDDKEQKVAAFNMLVHRLPRVNFALLRALSEYLLEVVQNSDKNKMNVKNVGIVFSPTLNIPAPVFAAFLTDFDAIFNQHNRQDRYEEGDGRQKTLPPPNNDLQPELRSPRQQTYSTLPTTPAYNQHAYHQNAQAQPHYPPSQPYNTDPAGDSGMAPMQASYEGRQYVSIPAQHAPPQPLYPAPQPNQPHHQHQTNQLPYHHQMHQHQQQQQPQQRQQYRMFAPENAANDKAKRRESAMLMF